MNSGLYMMYSPPCSGVPNTGINNNAMPAQKANKAQKTSKKITKKVGGRAPMAYSSQVERPVQGTERIRGKDIIFTGVSDRIMRIPCNPRFWAGTRARQQSLGFQTYTPISLRVRWLPAVPTTTAGQIFGGSVPVDFSVNFAEFNPAIMASSGSRGGPIWQPLEFHFDLGMLTQRRYFLNDISEDGIPIVMYLRSTTSAAGFVEIEYDFEVAGRTISPANIPIYEGTARTLTYPANNTSNAFTLGSGGLVDAASGSRWSFSPIYLSGAPTASLSIAPGSASGTLDMNQVGEIFDLMFTGSTSVNVFAKDSSSALYATTSSINAIVEGFVSSRSL